MSLGSIHTLRSGRVATAATAAALAVAGLAACGGGDDDTGQQGASTPGADTPTDTAGAPAAGSGDGDSGAGAKTSGGAAQRSGPALTGDPVQARRAVDSVDGVYKDFSAAVDSGVAAVDVPARQTLDAASGNASLTSICDLMSKEAQRQTIVYARRSAGLADVQWTCENATGLLLRRARQTGGLNRSLKAEIVGMNVEGDRATASIRFGGKGPISTVPMVREDGEWKLAATPAGGGE